MRFMLLQNYGEVGSGCPPMDRVEPGGRQGPHRLPAGPERASSERGELVDAQGLAGPGAAKFVVSDGASAPVVTDGPYPESKELLAGYRLVDVESIERAIEIAAQASAAPGPNGVPIRQPIEVRQVHERPRPEM